MKQFWISRTKKNKIAIKPLIIGKNIEFEIVGIDKDFLKILIHLKEQ